MSLPPRAVALARVALRTELKDVPAGATVAVACSGGADSLALVSELVFVARKAGWRTAALLVDHAMQDGSAEVTHRAARTCEQLGVDIVETRRVSVAQGGGSGGPEGAARAARYNALRDMAALVNAHAVLLGHTIDDQAETVLLGLARGSGSRSLAGMRPRIGIFRRPFLTLSRKDTEAICENAGVEFWVDPTNMQAADGPLRSQVRGRVLPLLDDVLGPRITETLARTAGQLQDDADLLDTLAGELYERALSPRVTPSVGDESTDCGEVSTSRGEGRWEAPYSSENRNITEVTLDAKTLENAPRALRTRALRTAALVVGTPAGTLNFRHIEQIERLVTHWRGQQAINLPGSRTVARVTGKITFRAPSLKDAR